MKDTRPYFEYQYNLIQQSRRALFDYCRTISSEDFLRENNAFGRGGSMRNLLVHIANTYEYWVIKHALKKDIQFTQCASKNTIDDLIELFSSIDNEVVNFFNKYESSIFISFDFELNGIKKSLTPCALFTHVITHEFHHKGQILSLSRHLGYTPIDTDIIR